MTARRRAALRKAQLASAKKRRRRRAVAGVATVGVLAATMKYRKYDRGQEANQALHLEAKANNALFKAGIHGGDGEEYTYSVSVPPQPKRYRNRPASQQTKRSIAQHRKTVLGKAVSRADSVITQPAPVRVRVTARKFDHAQSGPRFKKVKLSNAMVFGARVGNRRVSATLDTPRRTQRKRR